VTPSLNQGRFIEQTILSVSGQEYPNVEHIIVDGGSEDNTLSVLNKYEGTYDMQWTSEPDNGMYQAINKGMRRAKGQILAYLNTDDLYLPWTTRVASEVFDQHPRVDLVYGDMISVEIDRRTGYRNGSIIINPPQQTLRTHLRLLTSLTQPTVFWRRRVFDSLGGFDENLQMAGDYEFFSRASQKCRFLKVNEILAIARYHPQSKSRRAMAKAPAEDAQVKAKYDHDSMAIAAQRILYRIVWAGISRYSNAKLFMSFLGRTLQLTASGGYHHFLATRTISSSSLWQLGASFAPGFRTLFTHIKPSCELGYVDAKRLLDLALMNQNRVETLC
jgi:glycosyltransferase involved in cell wall biosynthesis